MEVGELIVRSSLQLFQSDCKEIKPIAFGSGCIVKFKNKLFLLSVSHVTRDNDLCTFIETNQPIVENTTQLIPIGGFLHFDLFILKNEEDEMKFEDIIENRERIDFTFSRFDSNIEPLQEEIDFKCFKVEAGHKVIFDLDQENSYILKPDKKDTFGFYGKVKPQYNGYYLQMSPHLEMGLSYHKTDAHMHMFLAKKIINDKNDFRGCSGAPILNSKGKIVGLLCSMRENSRIMYGVSIEECLKLLTIAIDANQI